MLGWIYLVLHSHKEFEGWTGAERENRGEGGMYEYVKAGGPYCSVPPWNKKLCQKILIDFQTVSCVTVVTTWISAGNSWNASKCLCTGENRFKWSKKLIIRWCVTMDDRQKHKQCSWVVVCESVCGQTKVVEEVWCILQLNRSEK